MKNKSGVIVTVIGFIIFLFCEAWGADWKRYMATDFGGWFYDAETIQFLGTLLNSSTCYRSGSYLSVLKLSTALATAEVQTPTGFPRRSLLLYTGSSLFH